MAKFILSLAFLGLFSVSAFAQVYSTQYRAPGQNWMELNTDRFRLVYPERYYDEALRTLSILESDYDDIQNLVGGDLRRFPFIINPDNDLSNGFVSTFNFRSEIELAPIRGKALNPRSGDWLESVTPHELVHALHFSVNPRSFTSLLGIFSPDMRRSVHAAAPLGILEGIAVQHESHSSVPGSGRGNHPYFTNQFNALLDTENEWSMGQLVHVTDFTPPFNRHYIGGYHFTNWLLATYGEEAMKRAIRFHYRYPFLGFGVALRHTTGYWPGSLYRDFTDSMKRRNNLRLDSLPANTDQFSDEIRFSAKCKRLARPLWLDNSSVLFYSRACNRPTGLYAADIQNDTVKLIREVAISEDLIYSLSEDRNRLYYSRYHPDMFYDNLFRGDLHQMDLQTGSSTRLTRNKRLFSPAQGENLYALQTDAHHLKLVSVHPATGEITSSFESPDNAGIVQAAFNPADPGKAAVIGKINGVQAIWLESPGGNGTILTGYPDIVFAGGSIYDLFWHPDGDRFLFTSDHTGTMNIYEYRVNDEAVYQITESLYNAFEGSYSPDGQTIAYVRQVEDEQLLFLLDLDNALNREIPRANWIPGPETESLMARPLMNREELPDTGQWDPEKYRTGLSWLKPRLWIPAFEQEGDFDKIGINLESGDLMGRHAYSLELNNFADRYWYSLTYHYKGFFPGFQIQQFNEPNLTTIRAEQDGEEVSALLLQQSRGGEFRVPVRLRFESNVRFSSFLIEPLYSVSQIRFLSPFNNNISYSDFAIRHTVGLRTVLNYNLRQFTRDVQPNSGLVLFTETRYSLNSDEFEIDTGQFTVQGNLAQRKGIRGGLTFYLSPLSRWNQSLRLSAQAVSQTDIPVFNLLSLYSDSFSEIPLSGVNNAGIFNTRYTIPITYPDDGRLLVPVYLSNIYLVLFSQTVADLNQPDLIAGSRSVFGAGIRSRFRLSNLAFDLGVSIGWEPMRNEVTYHFGSF